MIRRRKDSLYHILLSVPAIILMMSIILFPEPTLTEVLINIIIGICISGTIYSCYIFINWTEIYDHPHYKYINKVYPINEGHLQEKRIKNIVHRLLSVEDTLARQLYLLNIIDETEYTLRTNAVKETDDQLNNLQIHTMYIIYINKLIKSLVIDKKK